MRKKLICLAVALLLCAAALAEGGNFALRVDEGFTMSLPEGWVSYHAGHGSIRCVLG